ncbi:hypothetical protein, conserved [Trypanosoma brucei gambiense DAL972]|uniref:Uncharacterized protein n=1 Tax=Trypanosoma brucei gambiense (strain MHOM/CI/86/DAL972) TaxID=679716 RepID=D0A8N6_TRYB9|nr:hypothetical protein, conserved [Trypanosoma brucei gambiense DAL972]CBH18037.1 hypothetical protein, conserved [Trypanosoma brucei gambiense DAL972]|eukprot:XP_011780301.1 hypothetical protein, conserved [Trypanosoma brucei gambiense DAL972]
MLPISLGRVHSHVVSVCVYWWWCFTARGDSSLPLLVHPFPFFCVFIRSSIQVLSFFVLFFSFLLQQLTTTFFHFSPSSFYPSPVIPFLCSFTSVCFTFCVIFLFFVFVLDCSCFFVPSLLHSSLITFFSFSFPFIFHVSFYHISLSVVAAPLNSKQSGGDYFSRLFVVRATPHTLPKGEKTVIVGVGQCGRKRRKVETPEVRRNSNRDIYIYIYIFGRGEELR